MDLCIGVLAFQGAFEAHQKCLKALNVKTLEVKKNEDLKNCHGLILPGGESTVMNHLMQKSGMRTALIEYAKERPLFGTCAGLIMMAAQILNDSMKGLGVLDIAVERNAYGRQADSFMANFTGCFDQKMLSLTGFFIRAPQISTLLKPSVQVLATHHNKPVLIQQGFHLGATFHPELTSDLTVHQHFLSLIKVNSVRK